MQSTNVAITGEAITAGSSLQTFASSGNPLPINSAITITIIKLNATTSASSGSP